MIAVYQGYKKPATAQNRQTTSREPVDLAPDPAMTSEVVFQVYGARALGWRGDFRKN